MILDQAGRASHVATRTFALDTTPVQRRKRRPTARRREADGTTWGFCPNQVVCAELDKRTARAMGPRTAYRHVWRLSTWAAATGRVRWRSVTVLSTMSWSDVSVYSGMTGLKLCASIKTDLPSARARSHRYPTAQSSAQRAASFRVLWSHVASSIRHLPDPYAPVLRRRKQDR
jgi:hypothetical protein